MADKKLIAAAFVAGIAGGGVGGDQMAQQEIDAAQQEVVEVRAVLEDLAVERPGVDEHVENWTRAIITQAVEPRMALVYANQVIDLSADMQGDDVDVPLKDLVGEMFSRLRTDDPRWRDWLIVESEKIQHELELGYTVGTITPDTAISVNSMAARMAKIATEYIPQSPDTPRPIELGRDTRDGAPL